MFTIRLLPFIPPLVRGRGRGSAASAEAEGRTWFTDGCRAAGLPAHLGPAVFLVALLAVVLLAALPSPTHAQRPAGASIRVPTDHWANEYVARLRERGYLPGLNPLVQPWRAADIARALGALDPDTLTPPVRGWVEMLRQEFGWRNAELPTVRGGGSVAGGVVASSSQRLDPLRPLDDEGAWPWGQVGGWFETGPVVADLRMLGSRYLTEDPDGQDPGQRRGGRSDVAYVAADLPVASIEVGKFARNWFRHGTPGAMVSNVPTSYPQLGLELRAWRFALRSFTGELETIEGRKRYVSAHRLDYETDDFVASFGESNLYGPQSGALSLRFLNPVEFLFLDHDNPPNDATQNLMLNGQVWWRIRPVVLSMEFLLDDIDVAPTTEEAEPPVYAFTVAAQVPAVTDWLGVGAEYQQVSAWAYRTPNDIDRYSYLDRGLGNNFSDFDRLTVTADVYPPLEGLRLTPVLQFQRQGEGDFRDSIGGAYTGEPAIFLGVRETTVRAGLRGRYQPLRFAWLAWDVGYSSITNRGNVEGTDEDLFTAVAELGFRVDFPFRRP
jgi:hypothetical protein